MFHATTAIRVGFTPSRLNSNATKEKGAVDHLERMGWVYTCSSTRRVSVKTVMI